jgi:hypothetical protein
MEIEYITKCKHKVGECYLERNGVDNPKLVVYDSFANFYAFVDIKTGKIIYSTGGLESLDKYKPDDILLKTKFVIE